MEQKEQVVVKPKVTVTVEKEGKTDVSISEKAGICFLLHDDSVEVVQAYSINLIEMARLIDCMMRYGIKKMTEEEEIVDLMRAVKHTRQEQVDMFSEVTMS